VSLQRLSVCEAQVSLWSSSPTSPTRRAVRELAVDEIACCYHDDADACACRKPLPGMLVDAAERLGIPLAESFMVGDRWRDVEAGKNAGCRTIWLRQAYSERSVQADFDAADLSEAAEIIVRCWEDVKGT
jgi:histidinol phosphatase-like enzyme